jgi:hypothetical protein
MVTATSLPLPPPQVPLTRPDGSGKNTQQGFEFLGRLQAVQKALAAVTNLFDNLDSTATDALLQSLLDDNYESLGKAAGINTQTGSYTLVLADKGKTVEQNVAGANTLTIPPNSSVAFAIGTYVNVTQLGAGQTTLTAGAGVTLRAYNAGLKLSGQYAVATIYKRGTDEWVCGGNLTP